MVFYRCFEYSNSTQPPNFATGGGFLYYDPLCKVLGTKYCLDPTSGMAPCFGRATALSHKIPPGCRRCHTENAVGAAPDEPTCPLCVCDRFPNAAGCVGSPPAPPQPPPPPGTPAAPPEDKCLINEFCFAMRYGSLGQCQKIIF
jgi:hypothetical protein